MELPRHAVVVQTLMRRWALLMLAIAAALVASCKDATQVDVIVRTNVPYAVGAGTALWSSRTGASGGRPLVESSEAWLGDGEVGNVVVIPGEASKDSALTIRVAMGLRGKPATECTDDGDGRGAASLPAASWPSSRTRG